MRSVKIVVTGPFNAGKTTFIKTISEIAVLTTERKVTNPKDAAKKGETTVAMDFGRITVSGDVALYLFGTPGQERFSFMWETLSEGMLGFVILIDYSDIESLKEAFRLLTYFQTISEAPYVVAVNKTDGLDEGALAQLRKKLGVSDDVPFYLCDARDKESVKLVLLGLLSKVLEFIEKKEGKIRKVEKDG